MQPTLFVLTTFWQWMDNCLPYLYLLRIPILTAIALVAIPYLAFRTNMSALLKGLFDVYGAGLAIVSLLAFLTAWTILLTAELVLVHGPDRFNVCNFNLKLQFNWYQLFVGVLAIPMVAGAFMNFKTSTAKLIQGLGLATLGFLLSVGLLYWATNENLVEEFEQTIGLEHYLTQLGKGYFTYGNRVQGHSVAAVLLLFSMVIYTVIGICKYFWLNSRRFSEHVPTISYVILLLMILCWGLSGLTFFFDYYRIPVIIILAIVLFITAQFKQSDYYYSIFDAKPEEKKAMQEYMSPQEVVSKGNQPYVIIVAANGGGIQSSAWAAQVLTGLQKKFGDSIGRHIRLISSVSGGSVGAMYFTNGYTESGPPEGQELDKILDSAMRSSLNDVAWGLVYPDFWRTFFPFFGDTVVNRGWALEEAWKKNCDTTNCNLSKGLAEWREDVKAGWRPANIFNATISDTGQRFTMATTDLPKSSVATGSQSFIEAYPDKDTSVVTAARLSATFPYVTPAARADVEGITFHVVDGGYYDNYGMSSLAEWLDFALQHADNQLKRVLVLQIRGAAADTLEPANNRGWFYQAFAPIATLLHVRDAGQISHNDIEFGLLQKVWREKAATERVEIDTAIFEYESPKKHENPPLSWHLTREDQENIRIAWQNILADHDKYHGLREVETFLAKESLLKVEAPINS
jgi:hypothetical protein